MKLTPTERRKGQLGTRRRGAALETLQSDGYVVRENALPKNQVAALRKDFNAFVRRHVAANPQMLDPDRPGHGIFGLHPPREMPYMDTRIIANSFTLPILEQALGEHFFCAFYNTNTSWPGSGIQSVHRDSSPLVADHPLPLPCYSIVLNVPLIDFTVATGATEIWPGTHHDNRPYPDGVNTYDAWAEKVPSIPTEVKVGSLILRDMRMWHRGMPNRTRSIRTMLAVVYYRCYYDFSRKLDIPTKVWTQMPEEARQIFRYNTVV